MPRKAYHTVGSTGASSEELREIFDRVADQGQIVPARARVPRPEMMLECLTGSVATIRRRFPESGKHLLAALEQMALEEIETLPKAGPSGSLFNCVDLLAGDFDLIFLTPFDWYEGLPNGFVFDAEQLLKLGARFRPFDFLGPYTEAISIASEFDYAGPGDARDQVEFMLNDIRNRHEKTGGTGVRALRDYQKALKAGGEQHRMPEIVWPGDLPLNLAIEAWRDGERVD